MYIELHSHSYYSLLDGVPAPRDLIDRAAQLGMPAMALTDHDALYGVVAFSQAASAAGLRPIIGAELTLHDDSHLTLLAETDAGYANLAQLVTLARHNAPKGQARLPPGVLRQHATGLIALSGCRQGAIARALRQRRYPQARSLAGQLRSIFGPGQCFLEVQRHHRQDDQRINEGLQQLGELLNLPLVVTGNVHYLMPDDAPTHDTLTAIRTRQPLARAALRPNAEYYLRSPQQMQALFADLPEALANTVRIAERCNARPPHGPQALPGVLDDGRDPDSVLRQLSEQALRRRMPAHEHTRYQAALDKELALIHTQGLANYFLLVWDVVRYARQNGILCQGRGSAANSLVAWLLHITPIDPLSIGLVFERFLSPERVKTPDIDLDFAADRREEVIQYVYRKYGREHAAMACTMVTFGARLALREAGFALDVPEATLSQMIDALDQHHARDLAEAPALRERYGSQLDQPRWQMLFRLAEALDGLPRHLGIHNGAIILNATPLTAAIPTEPATMPGRTVVQWDKYALEDAQWVKLDILSLRMLSAIQDAVAFIGQQTGTPPDLHNLRPDDVAVYDMLCRGETLGLFQIESRAQANLIPRFLPRSFADLTVQIALIRPGPIQANMVHPYLRRRKGQEPVRHLHPMLRPALAETHGVILFQEQVLKVARDLAGLTPGEGELLRRALDHKRSAEALVPWRKRFFEGASSRGVSQQVSEQVFEALQAFGGYAFSKAHAAAFAVITYWSAWLRCYHPAAFFAGLLRHQPMGFYAPNTVIAEARRMGIRFLPVDLRHSADNVTLEGDAIRLGLNYVRGLGPAEVERVLAARDAGEFDSAADLIRRTGLRRSRAEALILAGALDHLGPRRQLLWQLSTAYRSAEQPDARPLPLRHSPPPLPAMPDGVRMTSSYVHTGAVLDGHLTDLHRRAFASAGVLSLPQLRQQPDGGMVRVGGLVIARQRPPTARGYAFLTLDDPSGRIDIVVHPDLYLAQRDLIRASFVTCEGMLQNRPGDALAVRAARFLPLYPDAPPPPKLKAPHPGARRY